MKALDGWKSLLVAVGVIVAACVKLSTGADVAPLLSAMLAKWGLSLTADARLTEFATILAPLLFALWAVASRIVKAFRQYRAGATPSELLSTAGYVKLAAKDGTLSKVFPPPPTLEERRQWQTTTIPSAPPT